MSVDVTIEIGGTEQHMTASVMRVDDADGKRLLTEGAVTLREHSNGGLELVTTNSE